MVCLGVIGAIKHTPTLSLQTLLELNYSEKNIMVSVDRAYGSTQGASPLWLKLASTDTDPPSKGKVEPVHIKSDQQHTTGRTCVVFRVMGDILRVPEVFRS